MSNIKDVRYKPRQGIGWSVAAMLRDVVTSSSLGARARDLYSLAMLTLKRELHEFLVRYLHVILFL